jgi:hypothetical protein
MPKITKIRPMRLRKMSSAIILSVLGIRMTISCAKRVDMTKEQRKRRARGRPDMQHIANHEKTAANSNKPAAVNSNKTARGRNT